MEKVSAAISSMPDSTIITGPKRILRDYEFWLVVMFWLAHYLLLAVPFPLNYDSVNLALAISDQFNIALHQPQPPGFLFHVVFGKVLFFLVKEPITVTELQSLIYLIVTLLIIRRTPLRKPGQLLLFGTIPLFLFFCAASVMQAASVPFSAAVAILVVKSIRNNRGYPVELAAIFAFGIGFRYDFALFLGPAALLVTILQKARFGQWFAAVLLFTGITLLWYVPTQALSSNVSPLLSTMEVQKTLSSGVSFLSGGSILENIRCTLRFLLYIPGVFGIGTLLVMFNNFGKISLKDRKIALAFLVPFLCMGIFIFMPLPQYYASITAFVAVFMMNIGQFYTSRKIMAGLIVANLLFFWILPRPALPDGRFSGRHIAINILKQVTYTGSNSAAELLYNKKLMKTADEHFSSCRTFYSSLMWDRTWKYCAKTRWGNHFTTSEDSAECILKYSYPEDRSFWGTLYPELLISRRQ